MAFTRPDGSVGATEEEVAAALAPPDASVGMARLGAFYGHTAGVLYKAAAMARTADFPDPSAAMLLQILGNVVYCIDRGQNVVKPDLDAFTDEEIQHAAIFLTAARQGHVVEPRDPKCCSIQ